MLGGRTMMIDQRLLDALVRQRFRHFVRAFFEVVTPGEMLA